METLDEYLARVQKIRGSDPRMEKDYDWEAAYKAGFQPTDGHGPDTFKRPNHPTFSSESMYHGQNGSEGGQWQGDDATGWTFTPGKTNLQYHSVQDLQDYFDKFEPDSILILPKGAK